MTISRTIGGKKFSFSKANLRIRDLYSELTNLVTEISLLTEDLADVTDEAEVKTAEAKSPVEKARIRRDARKKMRAVDSRRRDLTEDVIELRFKILEALLNRNGYEFDRSFWNEEADVNDINDLIVGVMRGDDDSKKR